MNVLCGIVLFNPDLVRLEENITAISKQVKEIAFFNNGEPIPSSVSLPGTILTDTKGNIGIASALNRLCEYALQNGFDWILTLDQDSVCPQDLIKEYNNYLTDPSIGMICPRILDRNYGHFSYDGEEGSGTEEIDVCITSASMLRLSAWKEIGGFWDDLFIDMVDFDICWTLKEEGFKILRVRSKAILHEVGHSKIVSLFGKKSVIYNHPPIRSYYMARNTIAVGRKHHHLQQCLRWNARRLLLINCYEKRKWEKDKFFLKGVIDGFRMKV